MLILRFMNDLQTPMTNNEAERASRPSKLHRKVSDSFRSLAGAERSANLRSYLDSTRKNDVSAMDALMRLLAGDPWMPPASGWVSTYVSPGCGATLRSTFTCRVTQL
jgi:hypothetical protein